MNGKGLMLALFLAIGAGSGGILSQQAPSATQSTQSASAQEPSSACQTVYGGGTTCLQKGKVILNKTIQHPGSSQLVESLSINDPKFKANQAVIFHLTVTNADTKEVKNVTVQDMLPNLLTYVSGDGKFVQKTHVFSFPVDLLNPGESKTRIVQMRVMPAEKLPKAPDTTCILNQATATYDGNVSQDNVQLCIENKVLGTETVVQPAQKVTQTPPTGASELAFLLLIPAALAGFLMIKRSAAIIDS